MQSQSRIENTTKSNITVRPLQETELSTADSIMRLAFGTFIGLPAPMSFMGDAAYVRNHGSPILRPLLLPRLPAKLSVQILQPTGAASASSVP